MDQPTGRLSGLAAFARADLRLQGLNVGVVGNPQWSRHFRISGVNSGCCTLAPMLASAGR